jgi:hypothetical protein
VGLSARRETVWKLVDNTVAFEFTDIGNGGRGSLFRFIHIGTESRYGAVWIRTGLNQGYFTAGLGTRFKLLVIDFSTYGEELSLNIGGLEDRRYTPRFSLQI